MVVGLGIPHIPTFPPVLIFGVRAGVCVFREPSARPETHLIERPSSNAAVLCDRICPTAQSDCRTPCFRETEERRTGWRRCASIRRSLPFYSKIRRPCWASSVPCWYRAKFSACPWRQLAPHESAPRRNCTVFGVGDASQLFDQRRQRSLGSAGKPLCTKLLQRNRRRSTRTKF